MESPGLIDLERIDSLKGMLLANKVINTEQLRDGSTKKRLQTIVSYDDGNFF